MHRTSSHAYTRRPNNGSLYDVLELILDKGLVIDAFVRVSLLGIDLLTVDVRVVIASVDTYLRFAERVDRLLFAEKPTHDLGDLIGAMGGDTAKLQEKEAHEARSRAVRTLRDDLTSAHEEIERLKGQVRGSSPTEPQTDASGAEARAVEERVRQVQREQQRPPPTRRRVLRRLSQLRSSGKWRLLSRLRDAVREETHASGSG